MANNESIIALQNFINSSAFGLMSQSTQDEIREEQKDEIQRSRKKSEAFSVTMPDGNVIQEKITTRLKSCWK